MKKNNSYNLYWFIIKIARSNRILRFFVIRGSVVFYTMFRGGKTFIFNKRKYRYFYHAYNQTTASERIVEIPIGYEIVKKYKNKKILEVGNVLSHYFKIDKDVLDKYEKGNNVINEDVVDFKSKYKYDLIISISTMEHVGWTYGEKRDSGKLLRGLNNLIKFVNPGGQMVVTFPLYYRKDLSELIINNKLPFQNEYFMVRTSYLNEWKQVSKKEAISGKSYDKFFANANTLYIGVFNK